MNNLPTITATDLPIDAFPILHTLTDWASFQTAIAGASAAGPIERELCCLYGFVKAYMSAVSEREDIRLQLGSAIDRGDALDGIVKTLKAVVDGTTFGGASRTAAHPNPDKFSGTASKLPQFLAEMSMKLMQNADWYADEQAKVRYYISRLEEKAWKQLEHAVNPDGLTTLEVKDVVQLL